MDKRPVRRTKRERWLSPSIFLPTAGMVVVGVVTVLGSIITSFISKEDPGPPDCAAARVQVIDAFDKHPEAVVPVDPNSDLNKVCNINEFMKQLKPRTPSPAST